MVLTHLIASRYTSEPEIAALIVMSVTVLLLVIGHSIVASFRRLAEASAVKSEFVSIASHQLRAPLASIKWASALMEDGGEKNFAMYRDIIRDNVERMILLVNDLLNVNRIESGTLSINPAAVELEPVVKDALKELTPRAEASNIALTFTAPQGPLTALVDRERIKTVVHHIVDNAIRYTPGKGTVAVTLEKEGARARLTVKDSGVGIPREDQGRVFQKFFRATNILKHQTVGTGLGLFIARSLTELFGGTMGFSSEEGKGSTFWFSLPLLDE